MNELFRVIGKSDDEIIRGLVVKVEEKLTARNVNLSFLTSHLLLFFYELWD